MTRGFQALPGGRTGDIPPCPSGLSKETEEAWELWWRSEVAALWKDADLPGVQLMAMCFDEASKGVAKAASEFRLLATSYGLLGPLSRLRIHVMDKEMVDDAPVDSVVRLA